MKKNGQRFYTLYKNPKDFPNACVVRGSTYYPGLHKVGDVVHQGMFVHDREIMMIARTVEELKQSFQKVVDERGLIWFDRLPDDDLVIVGVWT